MSFANDIRAPFKSGNVLMQLIIVNVAVFVILNLIRLSLFFSGYKGVVLDAVFHYKITQWVGMPMNFWEFIYKPWTIFTYMFTQIEIGHLFWNMVFIYFFGTILQDFMGKSRILAIYLYSGLMGGLLTLLFHSTVPALIEHSHMPIIGASGSVMGIVLAAATLVPDKTIFLLFLGPVKLIYIALFYVVVDLIGVSYIDGVGHIAHLGGALMGFMFIRLLRSGRDLSKPVNKIFYGGKNLVTFQRKPKMKVVKNTYTTSMGRDTGKTESKIQIQQRIDAILDKISKGGYESLSKEEKDYLFTHGKDI